MFLKYPQPTNPVHLSSLQLTIPLLVFQLPSKVVYTNKRKITDCGEGGGEILDFWTNHLVGLSLPEFTHTILQ
jgi:hypothetical protein